VTDATTALERLRARASASHDVEPRILTRRWTLDELARVLELDVLPIDLFGFRRRGRAREDGVGFVIDETPWGGSVIEGYHQSFLAVTSRGVVVRAHAMDEMGVEKPNDTITLEGDADAVRAIEEACAGSHGFPVA